jgi:hypothetical protein
MAVSRRLEDIHEGEVVTRVAECPHTAGCGPEEERRRFWPRHGARSHRIPNDARPSGRRDRRPEDVGRA